jgi:hypothetical protein
MLDAAVCWRTCPHLGATSSGCSAPQPSKLVMRFDYRRPLVLQHPARGMIFVGAISCGRQRFGIDDQHLAAPETLVQHLVGVRC